jgi:hypothetical protein
MERFYRNVGGQAVIEYYFTLKDDSDRLSRNVGKLAPNQSWVTSQEERKSGSLLKLREYNSEFSWQNREIRCHLLRLFCSLWANRLVTWSLCTCRRVFHISQCFFFSCKNVLYVVWDRRAGQNYLSSPFSVDNRTNTTDTSLPIPQGSIYCWFKQWRSEA